MRFLPGKSDDFLNVANIDKEILKDKIPARDPRGTSQLDPVR